VQIDTKPLGKLFKALVVTAAGLVATVLPGHAQNYLSGTYNCKNIEVAGKAEPCTAPSIELNSDGSYKILAERGTYAIVGGRWLVLSTSKNHGRARLDGNEDIIFEFVSGGKKSKIIYHQKYERPAGWVSS
jgi:hypothetical protein